MAWSIDLVTEAIQHLRRSKTRASGNTGRCRRHYTFSKVMCWVAAHRGAQLAEMFGLPEQRRALAHVGRCRTPTHPGACLQRGPRVLHAVARRTPSRRLEPAAANAGIIEPTDPRFVSTVRAYERLLVENGLMLRYSHPDDFGATTSAFTICSFWWVEALAMMGEVDERRLAVQSPARPRQSARTVLGGHRAADRPTARQLSAGLHPRRPDSRGDHDRRDSRSAHAHTSAPGRKSVAGGRWSVASNGTGRSHLSPSSTWRARVLAFPKPMCASGAGSATRTSAPSQSTVIGPHDGCMRRTRELFGRQRLEQDRQPLMDAVEDADRECRVGALAVRQLGPDLLLVGLDGRRVFRQRQLDPRVGVEVAVGQVMHDLARRPSAFAVRRVQPFRRERGERLLEVARQRVELRDPRLPLFRRDFGCRATNFPTGYRGSMTGSSASGVPAASEFASSN